MWRLPWVLLVACVDVAPAARAPLLRSMGMPEPALAGDGALGCSVGYGVAGADLNADGLSDVVVSSGCGGDVVNEGQALVWYGATGGPAAQEDLSLHPTDQANSSFGYAVARAGDVDGDGEGDLLVGARGLDLAGDALGGAWVYAGGAGGPVELWRQRDPTTTRQGRFGAVVAGAGDLDGDGFDDVAVAAEYGEGMGRFVDGAVYVFYGAPGGPGRMDTLRPAELLQTRYGAAVAAAGDVNGDGFDDLLIGAPGDDGPGLDAGSAWLYLGSAGGVELTPAWKIAPTAEVYSAAGSSVAGCDIDADGYGDVMVGAPQSQHKGEVWAYMGGPRGLARTPAWSWLGPGVGASAGLGLAAGDVNTDGFCDLLVGAGSYQTPAGLEGRVWLFLGSEGGLLPDPAWEQGPPDGPESARFGLGLAVAGDVNGDGHGDVVVGAPLSRQSAGAAWLFLGTGEPGEAPGNLEDEDGDGQIACYVDDDGDGQAPHGALRSSADADCDDPGELPVRGPVDCDDAAPQAFVGGVEVAGDTIDEDCDGRVLCYVDLDGDGRPPGPTALSDDDDCADPGEVATGDPDCDDADPAVWAAAPEVAGNTVDEDCDGQLLCFTDADADGYALALPALSADADCDDAGELLLPTAVDCDDAAPDVHPGATERLGDAVDEDCDNWVWCWRDADGDGFTAEPPLRSFDMACDDPGEGARSPGPDCDDASAAAHPGATEQAGNLVDEDCDGQIACVRDADADGHGGTPVGSDDLDCDDPGELAARTDCDDADPAVSPDAVEQPGDEVDEDCDGALLCAEDADGDGVAGAGVRASDDLDCADAGEAVAPGGDCDDADPAVLPGAVEVANNLHDDDCDGLALCAVDEDGDGWMGSGLVPGPCPRGRYPPGEDCDDADPDAFPGGGCPEDVGCGCAHGAPGGWMAGLLVLALRARRHAPPQGSRDRTAPRRPAALRWVALLGLGTSAGAAELRTAPSWVGWSDVDGDALGASTVACDLNGDGQKDVLGGFSTFVPFVVRSEGAYVFYREADGTLPDVPSQAILGVPGEDCRDVTCLGDRDGDGDEEALLGCLGGGGGAGSVELYLGSPVGVAGVPVQALSFGLPLQAFGAATARWPDRDGDGVEELWVAGPAFAAPELMPTVWLVRSSGPQLQRAPGFSVEAAQAETGFGGALAALDLDLDGQPDLIVGEPAAKEGERLGGRVVAYRGTADGVEPTPFWVWEGPQWETCGARLATGDLSHDGYPDLVIACPGRPADDVMAVVIQADRPPRELVSLSPARGIGDVVELAVGDVDADGLDDLAVGLPAAMVDEPSQGVIFVYRTSTSPSFDRPPDLELRGLQPGGQLGTSLDLSADWDGDGARDLLTGAFVPDIATTHVGGEVMLWAGMCPDGDGDRSCDARDVAPADALRCEDRDGDGCDDCAGGAGVDPATDGEDPDGDGLCGVPAAEEPPVEEPPVEDEEPPADDEGPMFAVRPPAETGCGCGASRAPVGLLGLLGLAVRRRGAAGRA